MLLVRTNVRGVSNMKKTRSKKIIKTVSILTVLALACIGLYLVTPKATPAPPPSQVSLTETPDYNACNIIKSSDIKSTFNGSAITSLSQSARAGIKAPNDTTGDSCGYSLTTAKSLDNSLSIEVYDYIPVINGNNKETNDSSWSEVASSNPQAYFGKDIADETVIYKLRVIPGGKNVMFVLRQPLADRTFDEPQALDFLVGLATKADYSVIDASSDF
jgi:hypothetical protein